MFRLRKIRLRLLAECVKYVQLVWLPYEKLRMQRMSGIRSGRTPLATTTTLTSMQSLDTVACEVDGND